MSFKHIVTSLYSKADGTREDKTMEPEEKVWEILLSADKKDYERICIEYGITNFRGMLKRLSEMKKEKEEEVAQVLLLSPPTLRFLHCCRSRKERAHTSASGVT